MNKESNFFYVKGTDLDHFYKDLKAAEDNYIDDIGSTVLKLGKLNEIFAKKVLSYENIEYDSSDTCTDIIYKIRTGVINTKFRDNISEKLKIIDYMNELRVERNFEIHADEDKLTSSEYIFKRNTSSKEMLMKMHEILKWYLIDLTKQISYTDEMKFEDPSKFNIHKNEIKKKEEEIYYIKRQIDDLNGLLKQSEQEKINNEADLEKMSRSVSRLEIQKKELRDRLKSDENELADIRVKADEEKRQAIERVENQIKSEYDIKLKEIQHQGEIEKMQNEAELVSVKTDIFQKNVIIDKLKSEINILKGKSENSSQLEKELQNLLSQKEELECKQVHLTSLINNYKNKIVDLKAEYDERLKKEKELLESEINSYKSEIMRIKKQADYEKKEALKNMEAKLNKEHSEKLKLIQTEREITIQENVLEVEKIKCSIAEKNTLINKLQNEISSLKLKSEKSDNLEGQLKKINDEKSSLENKYIQLNSVIISYDDKIKELENEYTIKIEQEKKSLYKDYENKLNRALEQLNNVEDNIKSKDYEIVQYKNEILRLERQTENLKSIKDSLNNVEEQKNKLEYTVYELNKKIAQKDEEINRSRSTLNRIINDYEKRIDTISSEKEEKIRELRDEYNNTNKKLKEKERYLIKSEEENLKLKNDIKKLKENNEDELSKKINEICAKEEAVDIQLNKLRKIYEECFNTTRKYQELLKESEKCIKRNENDKFVPQKKLIKAEIKVQDRDFDSSLNGYREKVKETKEKVEYVNEIINEKIFNTGEFKDFYKGFLEVGGDKLRLLYTMISKISMSSIIINKSKEIIFNSKEDELMDYIERKSESLKVLSDGEIRLKIYYRLLNLCGCSAEPVYDKRRFMSALDNVINTTYSMFESSGDFDSGEDKVKSINNYCMEKVINYFMKRNIDEDKPEKANLIDNIYISFSKLPYDKKEEIRTKLKLDSISEPFIKREINVNPKGFVTTVLSSGGFISILLTDSFMTSISDVNNGLILNQGQKLQKQIIPLFIMQLSYLSRDLNLNKINLDNYEQMISVWRNKKSEFDNISMQINIKDKVLNSLLKDKEENEDKLKKFKAVENSLYNTYGIKSDEFNKFVLDSEKKVHLPSYNSYSDAQYKNKEAMENIKNERQKLGLVKSIFSKEMWKNQSSRIVNDINISAIEKTLIKEATESEHFESEYSVIKKLKNDIDKTAAIINKIKSEIDDKEKRIRETSLSIDEFRKKCADISMEYPDII